MRLKTLLSLALFSVGVNAAGTHVSEIGNIQCAMDSEYCEIVLPNALNIKSDCAGNQVLVSTSEQQTISVLASAMFTQTKVKFHISEACEQGSPVVQSYQMIKG
ncbi:hypothetical protein TUMSATVNIG1_33520 [Vibrio nigripulchritudo]|uniref:hypothetical protein n=1 Tax=Vibrio nigripulchritudo TaxID=28173 RepID=UPI00190C68C7|nr:hypothetical protein [Vibrio nigripulchritudo]BCL71386.1 hypothetical protein VNTUMSATTG_33230 [Vibrio nigripulchritudo]BDU32743.1 hypothetical protein TUMSATVNIG1_33520 [Vibrio nigripulchritudo]